LVQTEKQAEFTVRGRMDIIADILNQAKHGTKKTRIMYMCNLSFRQLKVYLGFLLKKGFLTLKISPDQEKIHIFRTTKKGLAFLEAYNNLQAIISS
jgi:predicted transcriptional regulator